MDDYKLQITSDKYKSDIDDKSILRIISYFQKSQSNRIHK